MVTARADGIVLGEIEVAADQREPELVQHVRREDVRVADGEVRVHQILVAANSDRRSVQLLIALSSDAVVQRVAHGEVVARERADSRRGPSQVWYMLGSRIGGWSEPVSIGTPFTSVVVHVAEHGILRVDVLEKAEICCRTA